MDNSFARVKSIIERLREVLKCQKCSQMKEEDSMLFYHMCDHFYCHDCLSDINEACPLCKNSLDKPETVINAKNILSLYQSLAKFELPSKQDIDNIYRNHNESKQLKLNEDAKQVVNQLTGVQETPKNPRKSKFNSREKENKKNTFLTSPNDTGTIFLSSGEGDLSSTSKRKNFVPQNTSTPGRSGKSRTPARKGRGNVRVSTVASLGSTVTPPRLNGWQDISLLMNSTGSLKGNTSVAKSNINKRNPKGETQLHLACKKANFAAMTELIAAGANPNAQDNAGWTPLHDSVFSGNVEVIKFLLDNGAKVNTPGLENTTALHEAIAKGNVNIVKLLLDHGADVNAMNIFKETPLDLVTKYKLEDMRKVLSEASSNVKIPTVVPQDPEQELLLYKYNLSIEDEKAVNKFVNKFDGEIISSLTSKISPSHIVISDGKVQWSWPLICSVPKGCWVVTVRWVKDSLKENVLKPAEDYEPSLAVFSGFSKARANKLNELPSLFSGCHFFFGGNFEHYTVKNLTIGKEDLKLFVEKNGGAIVKRCPNPESLALKKTVPFHAVVASSLQETNYYIIYQTEKWDPMPKYNMSHIKTLPAEWLICCILKFELIDPNDKELWSDCF